MEPLHIYVLPVSGGYFPLQLAELTWMEGTPTPDLVLGSSGGNTSGYIAMAGNWTSDGIYKVLANINSSIFIKSWWPEHLFYIPSFLKGYFRGSAYKINSQFVETFECIFQNNSARAVATEMWTGVYNATLGASQFFCNRSAQAARLRPTDASMVAYNVAPPVYADGDLRLIGAASLASASIPAVLPPQHILGSLYYDGGMTYSSPLTAMSASLQPQSAHITYFSPYDISSPAFPDLYKYDYKGSIPGTMYSNGFNALTELYKSLMINDRMAGIALLGSDSTYASYTMTRTEFQAYQKERLKAKASFVEVYPLVPTRISYSSFTPADITDAMASVKQVGVRTWTVV
jgi:hypothetical protein